MRRGVGGSGKVYATQTCPHIAYPVRLSELTVAGNIQTNFSLLTNNITNAGGEFDVKGVCGSARPKAEPARSSNLNGPDEASNLSS